MNPGAAQDKSPAEELEPAAPKQKAAPAKALAKAEEKAKKAAKIYHDIDKLLRGRAELPEGWASAVDPATGRTYYISPEGETSWGVWNIHS